MPDFKKPGFKKSFGPRREFDGPKKLYKAECSNCHGPCEVPFRPNGMKPVFCRNCFNRDRSEDRAPERSFGKKPFQKREFAPRESFAPRSAPADDRRIDDLKRQLANMEAKLDRVVALVEASQSAASSEAPKVKKAPAKKVAKKK